MTSGESTPSSQLWSVDCPLISVVIPCASVAGRSGDELRAQLHSLCRQDYVGSWEVVLVDNAGDGCLEPLVAPFVSRLPNLMVVLASTHRGKSFAVNTAVPLTRGRVLVLLDSDDTVNPGYLRAIAQASQTHDVMGARLDTKVLNEQWLRSRRGEPQAQGLERLLDHHPTVIGAGMSLTRAAWDAVGGFRLSMLSQQDVDLSWRLVEAGYEPTFVPDAVVHYRYRQDLRSIWRQERAYGEYEALLYRNHRSNGVPRRRLRRTLRAWARVVASVPRAVTRAGRVGLTTDLASAVGRVRGSLRHRVWYV